MGLVLKLSQNQRIYFDDLCLEVSKSSGQIKLHFFGEPPFPFEIKRESAKEYKTRMGDLYGCEVHIVQSKKQFKNTK